jgi:hypothetical protein
LSHDPPIVTIYFDFYGESFDPEEITERLKMEPTSQFKKGGPIPPLLSRNWRRDGWMLKVGPLEIFEIDGMLDQLKAAVTAPSGRIKEVASELGVEAEVTCEIIPQSEALPAMVFPAGFVDWAAARGANISVDIIARVGGSEDD